MPRDSRLYMTFPIDFWMHPKVSRLSDAAFRAFVESNGHSRMRETDGVLEADDAEFLWSVEALAELVKSHPLRPLMIRNEGGDYVLRDYAEHQFTKADRDELTEKRARAGRASADKRRTSAEHVLSTTEHESTRKESGSGTGDFYATSQSQSLPKRASVSTDSIEVSEMTRRLASQKGITSLRSVVDAVIRHTGKQVTADQAFQLSTWLLEKAPTWPDSPQRYVTGSIKRSPFEIEQYLDGAVA